ncbi:MAG: class I SAM-dependent methyltransferase [Bdellovibrionales bacterium]
MADPIFENTRLVEIYDTFDGQRNDLDHYLAMVKELNAKSVLDVGCGTGSFACLLGAQGYEVTGIDPAEASLNAARKKPYAKQVRWILGDTSRLPALAVDLAVMTGNVAQVFVTENVWKNNLIAIRQALRDGGHIVFEARDPAQQAWVKWTREHTYQRLDVPNIGFVEGWCDVTDVSDGLVSFRYTYVFDADGQTLTSDSTLRFREKDEIIHSLEQSGYQMKDIRDAPDRPKQEFVFIAAAV